MEHFLYLEVQGIQRFVFASTSLKILRGGSALLDSFNRVDMREAADGKPGDVLVAGGGHCLVGGLSREDAEGIASRLARELHRKTDGQVSLAFGISEASAEWKATWMNLHEDRAARALRAPPAPPPLPPFVALCSSCGVSAARELLDLGDGQRAPLCAACSMRLPGTRKGKTYHRNRQTTWQRMRPYLGPYEHPGDDESFDKRLPDRELQQIVERGSRREYLAYLYCDGNAMGSFLRAATSAEDYGKRSRLVDEALHQAVAEAIMKHCPPDQRRGEEKFCAEVLLLGGDDLVVVLPADRGVGFTSTVLERFHEATDRQIRLSAGLVLAHHKTPIAILQQVATSLLRSAKRYAYLEGQRPSGHRDPAVGYVDFRELTSAEPDVDHEHAVTCRPYRLDDFQRLVKRVREVGRTRVPSGRLHALAEAVHGSKREALTMTQLVLGRARSTPDRDQRAALLRLLSPLHSDAPPAHVSPYTLSSDATWDLPFELYPESHLWSVIPDAIELVDHLRGEGEDA